MIRLNQDNNYTEAVPDLKLFFYKYQLKPIYKRIRKPIMLISRKNILDMFKINLLNHRKARLALQYHLHGFTPSEIDGMWYMDFENKLFDLSELLKEKQDAEKKQYDESKSNSPDYGKQMKSASSFKAPNFKTPSFSKF